MVDGSVTFTSLPAREAFTVSRKVTRMLLLLSSGLESCSGGFDVSAKTGPQPHIFSAISPPAFCEPSSFNPRPINFGTRTNGAEPLFPDHDRRAGASYFHKINSVFSPPPFQLLGQRGQSGGHEKVVPPKKKLHAQIKRRSLSFLQRGDSGVIINYIGMGSCFFAWPRFSFFGVALFMFFCPDVKRHLFLSWLS